MTKAETAKYNAKYCKDNKKKIAKQGAAYRKANKTEVAAYSTKYRNTHKAKKATYDAIYRKANKEKIKEYANFYRNTHKKELSEFFIKYRKANKKKFVEYASKYYIANKERLIMKSSEYSVANKEKVAKYRSIYYRANKEKAAENGRIRKNSKAKYDICSHQLSWVEEIRRNPTESQELQVKCALCNKWLTPTNAQVQHRIHAINGIVGGDNNFYCSENCKQNCPVYKRFKYRKGQAPHQKRPGQKEWRDRVIVCSEYTCERCGRILDEKDLTAHHIRPVVQYPLESMDIDNGMALCKDCDAIVHSEKGCRPVDLRCNA